MMGATEAWCLFKCHAIYLDYMLYMYSETTCLTALAEIKDVNRICKFFLMYKYNIKLIS